MTDSNQNTQQTSNPTAPDPKPMQPVQPAPAVTPIMPTPYSQPAVDPNQGMVSAGSKEAQAMQEKKVESAPARTEFGYEEIQKIEREAAPESIEKKEQKPVTPAQAQQQTQPQQAQPTAETESTPEKKPLKFFGYRISPQLTSNLSLIKGQKGKGDPNLSRTWIFMLLDRLLKKQSASE